MLQKSLKDLVGGDFNTRWQAAKVLKTFGEKAHEPLIEIAESSFHDPDLQGFIVGILGANPTPEALLSLITILKKSTDDELKESIVLALGKQGPSQLDALLSLSTQPELQSSVLRALVQINHPDTIEGLLTFAKHDNNDFRVLAFEALGQFHGPQITELLRQGLTDTASGVRAACIKALGMRQSNEINESLVNEVSALLYDTNPQVCDLTTRALGRFNHPLAIDYLWRRLIEQSIPTPLTQSLIQALGWSNHPNGVNYLLKLITWVSSEEQKNQVGTPWPPQLVNDLIQAIANLDAPEELEAISQKFNCLLSSQVEPFGDIQVKQRLIMAIARLEQNSSIPVLIESLAIEDDRMRFHLIAALKQINAALSHDKLTTYHQDSGLDPILKEGIAIALKEW